ncbi:MAG: hypothetical protein GC179_12185 [Anaerolineaceae bacterium]|nr:hypothetical protein [Anaerolineaceae bacterium]
MKRFVWSERFFRLMLRLYPARHRSEYGEAMIQHFRDVRRDAVEGNGKSGLLKLGIHMLGDTLKNAPLEHWIEIRTGGMMRNKSPIVLVLALLGAVLVGYIDSRASEVQATLMVMLPITFVLGFFEPKRAALWAIIVGLSVPVSYVWLLATGQQYSAPPPNGFTTLIAIVPALIGTFSGAIFRKVISQVTLHT